jgi:hypothetical protein
LDTAYWGEPNQLLYSIPKPFLETETANALGTVNPGVTRLTTFFYPPNFRSCAFQPGSVKQRRHMTLRIVNLPF